MLNAAMSIINYWCMILLYMRCIQEENRVCPWFFSVEFFEKLCQFKFHNVIRFESRIKRGRMLILLSGFNRGENERTKHGSWTEVFWGFWRKNSWFDFPNINMFYDSTFENLYRVSGIASTHIIHTCQEIINTSQNYSYISITIVLIKT